METKTAKLKLDPEIKLFESMDFDIDNNQNEENNEILEISAVKSEADSENFDFETTLDSSTESNSNASENQFEFEIGFEDKSTQVQLPLDLSQEQALFPNLNQKNSPELKVSNSNKKPINNAPEYKPDQNGIYDLDALIAASFVLD